MSQGLRVSVSLLGVLLCALSIFLNFQLYTSLTSSDSIEKLSYQAIGILLDSSKVVCLLLAVWLWFSVRTGRAILLGTISFCFYVILTIISLGAGFGFSLNATKHGEDERLKNSFAFQSVQSQVESIDKKTNEYSAFANINVQSVQKELDSYKSQLADLKKELSSCPKNYITHCIKPKQYEINTAEGLIAPLQKQIDGYNAYTGALKQRADALASVSNMDNTAVSNEVIHPLFIAAGRLFNVSPQVAKESLLLVSFTCLELLGSLFFAVGLSFNSRDEQNVIAMRKGDPEPTFAFHNEFERQNKRSKLFKKGEDVHTTPLNRGEDVHTTPLNRGEDVHTTLSQSLERADNSVTGENSHRYQAILNAIQSNQIKPTLQAIQSFKHGGVGCNKDIAKRYVNEMLSKGIIESYRLNNGKTSYRLKSGA